MKDSLQHDPVGVRCCPTWQWPWLHGWRYSDKTQDRILSCCDVEGSLEVELRFCELIEGLEPNWTTTVTTMALVSRGPGGPLGPKGGLSCAMIILNPWAH